ncbi:MAG TPA: thioredoxin domain-containing protein [Candidatus Saccharimonadales bacterium]|nr:thioredoxin domain-containing protein [Candidatus Saccharimonadales bacterium]
MANRLAGESSPYLLQHAENPVDWHPWGDAAFERARNDDRPVLLSIGYSACHWCHVMAHESFENAEIAAIMNALFVSIKVDREERPDVDTVYMSAAQAMGIPGGWPLTVFLTPAGMPFFGGTYFPPVDRPGLRGFPAVLRAAAAAYHDQRDEIGAMGEKVRDAVAPRELPAPGEPTAALLDAAVKKLAAETDRAHGGFGAAPKFPHPQALDLMLRRAQATGDPVVRDAAMLSLDAMSRGGIHDQVGGGFHRYSVDARWSVPHFEKMLYDNALLAPVYLHAHQVSGREDMLEVCTRTLDYMTRELRLPGGAFAASQDADSPGGEGAFFVWTPPQLRDALGVDDAALAARVFGVVDGGNFEHGTTVLSMPYPLAQVARSMSIDEPALRARLEDIRARLRKARGSRPAPERDGKVITAWNALAIRAFAEAGAALERPEFVAVARACADFVLEHLVRDGVVYRIWNGGEGRIIGFLDDTANLGDALLTLYEATGAPRYFTAALGLCERIVEQHRDADGNYFDTAGDSEPLIVRPRTIDDNPVSAGQSVAAALFCRMHAFTGEERWNVRAMEIIAPLATVVARAPLAVAGLAAAMELAVGPMREIAIAGDPDDTRTRALLDVAQRRFDPLTVLAWGPADGVPLLGGRTPVDGVPAAYVCRGFVCQAPVTEATELAGELAVRD